MLGVAGAAAGQGCPPIDFELQKKQQQECAVAGGEWSRFGVRDYLCSVYSCAERTKDAGKPCRNRSDCEYLCVDLRDGKLGAEVTGQCAAVKTSFGCFTHVDHGKIIGRVCVE
jgi:hypothetical protein